jgi:hypothetical protein
MEKMVRPFRISVFNLFSNSSRFAPTEMIGIASPNAIPAEVSQIKLFPVPAAGALDAWSGAADITPRTTGVINPLNAALRLASSTNGNSPNNSPSRIPTAFTASSRLGLSDNLGIAGSGPITINTVSGSQPPSVKTLPSLRMVGVVTIPLTTGKRYRP